MKSHRLSDAEKHFLDENGYLVREGVFSPDEVARMGADCEALVQGLTRPEPGTPKIPAGSYLFQLDPRHCTMIKWEPGSPEVVQGVEPFAHFDDALNRWGQDARFTGPMLDLLGAQEVELFTEKLNLKRARHGGPIVLHQDYPYWIENSQDAGEIATAIVFLDDANRENGCLEVIPGSHKWGPQVGRDTRGFGQFEIDPDDFDTSGMEMVEVRAGSIVCFGSLIVHRSTPNRSAEDRRALLYSYQPAGRVKSWEGLAAMLGQTKSAQARMAE